MALSASEKMRAHRARKSDIAIPVWSDPSRTRKRCEKSLASFIRTYLPKRFPLKMSPDHLRAIERMQSVILDGGQYAQSAPRGDGKTERSIAAVLWALLYGHRRFLVVVGSDAAAAKVILGEVMGELCDNDKIAADWPHICAPLEAAAQHPNRVRFFTHGGEPLGMEARTTRLVFPSPSGSTDHACGAICVARGLTGGIRGLRFKGKGDETLRPDLLVIDDPQTDESAHSVEQVAQRENLVTAALMGLAGPSKTIAAVCNCTIIAPDDLAERLTDPRRHPEWRGIVARMVYRWPDNRELWKEYVALRKEGHGDGFKAATAFYKANREAMDKGAAVGWEQRKRKGELSAIQCAYNLLADIGEDAFAAEYQSEPRRKKVSQYEVTAELILSRLCGMPRLSAPQGAEILIAAADLNYTGLNWALIASRRDAAAWVVDYGKHPEGLDLIDKKRTSGLTEAQAIAAAVNELATHLNALQVVVDGKPRYVDMLLVDVGYMTDTVLHALSAVRLPMRTLGVRGRAAKTYLPRKEAIKTGDGWQLNDWRTGRVMIINADHWREQMQRAFLLPPGTPGSIALCGESPRDLRRLAEECSAERLIEKIVTDRATHYAWTMQPGARNDLGDALTYAYAAANMAGASPMNGEAAWRQRSEPARQRTQDGRVLPRRVARRPLEE